MGLDIVNGLFALCGGVMMVFNIVKLYSDKQYKGVHWGPMFFFVVWNVYSLFFLASLGQWFSFAGHSVLAVSETTWVGMMVYYWWHEESFWHGLSM